MSSSLETRLRYTPSDIFDPFPFMPEGSSELSQLGERYHSARTDIMVRSGIGLTDLYNRFHEPDCTDPRIADLRALNIELDQRVLDAYGWPDVALNHGFHAVPYLPENDRIRYTICEEARLEILRRLARLNRERYEEERCQAEIDRQTQMTNRPPRPRRGKKPKLNVIQGGLF